MDSQKGSLTERFSAYFEREVAQKAASSLANGAEIEFCVGSEKFTFTRQAGRNQIIPRPAKSPQLVFVMPPQGAEAILNFPSEEIGPIGVHIARLVVSPDANLRIAVQFKAGFLSLFTLGYLGVVTAGGAEFASYLASRGLNGIGAIKSLLKKAKSD